jgi:small conductance mechanosensitive channel
MAPIPQEPESTETTTNGIEQMSAKAGSDVKAALDGLREGDFSRIWPLLDGYIWPAIQVLLFLFVGYLAAKFIARIVSTPIQRRVDMTLGRFVGKLIYYAIMISIVVAILGRFGFQVTSFAAILASAGFAIGMAFQGTLGNFSAGIMLLVFRPFKVGDVVNAAGVTAKVHEIDLFTTRFDTFDNRRIIVPNGEITSGTIENISFHPERRIDVSVGCDYTADLQHTRQVLTEAAESLQEFLVEGDGRGFQIALGDLGDSAVMWTVRFWAKASDFGTAKERLTEEIKNRLDAAGIGIPYPQMDVHLFRQSSDAHSA